MKIKLTKPARVTMPAGTVVETGEDEARFLISVGAAEKKTAKTAAKKDSKKEE